MLHGTNFTIRTLVLDFSRESYTFGRILAVTTLSLSPLFIYVNIIDETWPVISALPSNFLPDECHFKFFFK